MFSSKKYEDLEKELEDQVEVEGTVKEALDNPQESMFEGIEADEMDLKPDFKTEFEEIIELKNRKGLEIKYSFNGKEISEALKIFQRDTIFKRNLIYTGILTIIFAVYISGVIKDQNALSMFLSVMCIAVTGFIWYLPYNHRMKTAKAADTHELNFTMTIYDDCVKIGEEEGSFIMKFNNEITKIFETMDQFLVCAGKERIFLLPKRFLDERQIDEVKAIFQANMNDKYIKKL